MTDNFKKLEEILGFNPSEKASPVSPTASLLAEVRAEVIAERTKIAKDQARKAIMYALELHERGMNAKKQFDEQWTKFNDELGNLINGFQQVSTANEEQEQQQPDTKE